MPIAASAEPRSWETRRSAFRHDWLKNTYLNRLGGFLSALRAADPDRAWLLEFVEEDLPMWEEKRDEARWVIAAYEDEMSPRTLFDQPPLSRTSPETRRWLGPLVHRLWQARYAPGDDTEAARDALERANDAYDRITEQLGPAPDVEQLKALRPDFEALETACTALGKAMSNFLRAIKAV